MAFTKQQKTAMMEGYRQMLNDSQAIFVIEYSKMNMIVINDFYKKAREAGGEFHVVKNTLFTKVFEELGYDLIDDINIGPSLVGFAFKDAPALAKVVVDITKADGFKIKGGYLDKVALDAAAIKNLSDLPPLPVMRAKLLGTINAPASKLVRTINEPGRSLAAVLQAYVTKQEEGESEPA